jgi:hypothetical protein
MKMRSLVSVALVLILLSLFSACTPAPKSPSEVVKAFFAAGNAGKYSECDELLSLPARNVFKEGSVAASGGLKGAVDRKTRNGTVERVDILSEDTRGEGSEVLCKVYFKGGESHEDEEELIKEKDGWKITVPSKNSLIAENEASAIHSLIALNTAEITFAATYNAGFVETLSRLGTVSPGSPDINHPDLLDRALSGSVASSTTSNTFTKDGYVFSYAPGPGPFRRIATYTITARPVKYGKTGRRSFFTNETAVIRLTPENRPAGRDDNPL